MRHGISMIGAVLVAVAGLAAQGAYVPQRVFDTSRGAFSDFETMLADLARADVVFVGEQHGDPNTHRLELMLLEGLARRRGDIVLSLEMFERDAQPALDQWRAGLLPEDDFLRGARPWPRYATDYKPLVHFAQARQWPIVAANVPRPIASEVSRGGLDILPSKSEADHALFAADLRCPTDDDYFRRFGAAMGSHPAASGPGQTAVAAAQQTTERYYFAQCLKDETMAESIAAAWQRAAAGGARPLVVHYNGAFHSDFAAGTAERTIRRMPGRRVAIVTVLPVADVDAAAPNAEDRRRAGYLVYTTK